MSGTLQASIVKDSASSTSNLTLDTSGNVTVGNNLTVTGSTTVSATSIGNLTYTGTLTGSTGILNIGSGQIYKDASGNVGIGTSSPTSTAGITTLQISTASSTSRVIWESRSNSRKVGWFLDSTNNFGVYDYTASAELMRIDSSGNLLVGTTVSLIGTGGCVQAVGATTNRGYLVMGRATASTSGVCGSLIAYNATNTIASFDFQANGANNSGLIQAFTFSAGSAVQGPYVNTGGTSWTTASDENLKDIIEPVENGVEKLSSLRSVIGKFKTDHDDVRRVFLIAQDVQKVLPEAICTDPNGYLGLNYQDLIPVLVKAIQELSEKNDALEARLAALEAK